MSVLRTKGLLVARAVPLVVVLLIFCGVASAYTIVMRGGRHVEVPNQFLLTDSTLTYEVSPGIQVTINLAAIDIPATEKANKEGAGSFFKHRLAIKATETVTPVGPARSATRTITNRDLESATARRRQSEIAYEKRRKELGLPSPVVRNGVETISQVDWEEHQAIEREQESYWRGRAESLRTEIASVDAQIEYLKRQLEEPAYGITTGSYATVVNVLPFGFGGFNGSRGHFDRGARPGIFVGPRAQPRFGVVFGGNRFPSTFPRRNPFPNTGVNRFPLIFPPNGFVGSTYPFLGSSDVQGDLITQLNELSAARAGLLARWRELEDEARRAGAPPGWLRP